MAVLFLDFISSKTSAISFRNSTSYLGPDANGRPGLFRRVGSLKAGNKRAARFKISFLASSKDSTDGQEQYAKSACHRASSISSLSSSRAGLRSSGGMLADNLINFGIGGLTLLVGRLSPATHFGRKGSISRFPHYLRLLNLAVYCSLDSRGNRVRRAANWIGVEVRISRRRRRIRVPEELADDR